MRSLESAKVSGRDKKLFLFVGAEIDLDDVDDDDDDDDDDEDDADLRVSLLQFSPTFRRLSADTDLDFRRQ